MGSPKVKCTIFHCKIAFNISYYSIIPFSQKTNKDVEVFQKLIEKALKAVQVEFGTSYQSERICVKQSSVTAC